MHGGERVDVLVVCSSGGHLSDAVALSGAWNGRSRAWVSFDKPDVRSLLAAERLYVAYGPTNRNLPNLLRNIWLALHVVGRTRPRVMITTGAGVAVPFAWVARVRGAYVVYVECAGRVDRPSLSGRLIAPVASRIYAQWPELAANWPRACYAGNVLLGGRRGRGSPGPRSGVLATVGTNEAPFDRLLRGLAGVRDERMTVQHGPSRVRVPGATWHDYMPSTELDALMRTARVVVTHAGVGSVAAALANGRRPVVVPRLRSNGEAVDDHQLHFARRLAVEGLATVVLDAARLPEVIRDADHAAPAGVDSDLGAVLAGELDDLLDRPARRGALPRRWRAQT